MLHLVNEPSQALSLEIPVGQGSSIGHFGERVGRVNCYQKLPFFGYLMHFKLGLGHSVFAHFIASDFLQKIHAF